MPDISSALVSIRPGANWLLIGEGYSGLNWLDKTHSKPTEEEINAEILRQEQQAPLDSCKAKAKELIAITDWAVLPDINLVNKKEFIDYRAALRDLITNPVADPVWPTEPQPIWS